MNGTIYDDCTRPLFAFDGGPNAAHDSRAEQGARRRSAASGPFNRPIAIILNPRSYRNKQRPIELPSGVRVESPRTRPDLRRVLGELTRDGVELVIVAGGDGTVRDVLTCGADIWRDRHPVIGVLPCGKTNALAIDLGVPDDATLADLIAGWERGAIVSRPPIEITLRGENHPVLGFLFGGGAFVDATDMAQTTHRFGAVNNLAVGLSIFGAVASTFFGGNNSPWRAGKRMAIRYSGKVSARHGAERESTSNRFILLASTMERLPLGLRIFGERRAGLKTLVVDAPPRRFLRNFIAIMRGVDKPSLEHSGIHRVDASEVEIDLDGGFVLDGERFPAGDYLLREGAPIRFVTV